MSKRNVLSLQCTSEWVANTAQRDAVLEAAPQRGAALRPTNQLAMNGALQSSRNTTRINGSNPDLPLTAEQWALGNLLNQSAVLVTGDGVAVGEVGAADGLTAPDYNLAPTMT